jgi:negative regulator of sigma E activity
MDEDTQGLAPSALETRSRALFQDSVDAVDMRVRSRLTQARHAALDAAAVSSRRPWFLRTRVWTPAVGVTAAAVLGVALFFGSPIGHHGMSAADMQPNLEDLDMVASGDGSVDALDMLQEDLDFYDFADKAANSGSPTSPSPAA